MSILDRLLRRKNKPKQAARLIVNNGKRHFDAADEDRLTYDWSATATDITSILAAELGKIRERSRNEFRNDDYGKGFIRSVQNRVIGPAGVITQAKAMDASKEPGGQGTPDIVANQAIEKHLKRWSDEKHCDISGRMTWPDFQRLWIANVARDGEAIVRKWWRGEYGFSQQMIDPSLLDHTLSIELSNGNSIVLGVEVDSFYRPVAYYFEDANGISYGGGGKRHTRIPADEIRHSYIYDDDCQPRGVPWMTTSLPRMHMLKGLEDAALVASREGANKGGYFLQDVTAAEEYKGDGRYADGTTISESAPGEREVLPPGYTPYERDPAYPHEAYPGMVKVNLRGTASGLGVNYNTLANDLEGVNYSSLREGKLSETETWRVLQSWVITELIMPTYNDWIEAAIFKGAITFPWGTPLPASKMDKWRQAEFQARGFPWVDPKKEEEANEIAWQRGSLSVTEIIRSSGRDPETVITQWEADRARLGITTPPTAAEVTATTPPGSEDDEDEE